MNKIKKREGLLELAPVKPNIKLAPIDNSAETLIAQAIANGTPVEVMERLLAMRRELKAEQAKEAFDQAMSDFQSECPVIEKTKAVNNKPDKGGGLRYKFAPLDVIVVKVRDILKKYGFSYTINAKVEDESVMAICKITHRLGHSETSEFQVPIDSTAYMNNQQMFASALTFAKRYAFTNAFGILTGDEDDDARSASNTDIKKEPATDVFKAFSDAIENAKTEERILLIHDRVDKSKALTDDQKEQLTIQASIRSDEIKEIGGK